jgi:20S proteasome alpha/beta subunit
MQLAKALRKGPYQTNILLGGYDEKDGAALYFIDYLASMQASIHDPCYMIVQMTTFSHDSTTPVS